MNRSTKRSDQARAWRAFYNTAAWKRARIAQLTKQPQCERCDHNGFFTIADKVNHRTPHKGDWALFIDPANHESACGPCHDQVIQSEERSGKPKAGTGYHAAVGADGQPTDPRHPFFAGE